MEWEGFDIIDLAEDREAMWAVVNAVTNLPVPHCAGNFLTTLETISLSVMTLLDGTS